MVMTLPKIRNRRTPLIHILESRAGPSLACSISTPFQKAHKNDAGESMGLTGWNAQFFEYARSLLHRGARDCREDEVTRECGPERFPIP